MTPNENDPTSNLIPENDPDDEVVDAASLPDSASSGGAANAVVLRRRWFNEQTTLFRFISKALVPMSAHRFVPCGSAKLTLQCNGASCVLCMAKHKATPIYLVPVYFIDDHELAVIEVDQVGGAGSLRGQLIVELKKDDFSEFIYEATMVRRQFTLARVGTASAADGGDYGAAVLRDLAARGGIRPKDVRAVIERRDNKTLLFDLDWLAPKIRLYHPGVEISTL